MHCGQETHPPFTQKKSTTLEETLSRTQPSPSRWTLIPNPETLELQKNCNFKEDETTDSICLCARGKRHSWYFFLSMRCDNRRALQMIQKEKHEQRHRTASQKMRVFEETPTAAVPINNCTGRQENTGRRLLQKEKHAMPIQKQGRMKYRSIAEKLRPMWKTHKLHRSGRPNTLIESIWVALKEKQKLIMKRRIATTEVTSENGKGKKKTSSQPITARSSDMEGHVEKCVERYCEFACKRVSPLMLAETPCIDDHQISHFFDGTGETGTSMYTNGIEMTVIGQKWQTRLKKWAGNIGHRMEQSV